MSDRQIPMAPAELLTVTPSEPEKQDTYGTAAPQKTKKNHTGLIVCLSLLCAVFASVLAIIGLTHQRLELSGRSPVGQLKQGEDAQPDQMLHPNTEARTDAQAQSDFALHNRLQLGGQAQQMQSMDPAELYEAVTPSVVCVTAEGFNGSTAGTGIILDQNGFVLTANDVVNGATEIALVLYDGTEGTAQLIGTDSTTGFALLHCDLPALTAACFGDAEALRVGDKLYCIGCPYGEHIRNVLSEGMLSVCSRVELAEEGLTLLQTSASFGAGVNGCPIFDSAGNLIGVTCPVGAFLTDTGEDPGFAVSAVDVQRIAQQIMTNAASKDRRWLGFEIEEIPEAYRFYYDFPGTIWIKAVGADTHADGALSVYDVILSVDGIGVSTVGDYEAVLAAHEIGDVMELRIFRGGFFYRIRLPLTAK